MHIMMLAALLFAVFGSMSVLGQYGDNCSRYTWYTSMDDTTCRCGNELEGGIICSEMSHQVYLQMSFCMTWSNTTGTLAGICRYGPYSRCNSTYCRAYTLLPTNPAQLNAFQCTHYNRKGFFCGECIEGFGPSVFPFSLKCTNSSMFSPLIATSIYLTLELVPVTIFFFLIMIFHINITTGPMLGYIFFCQVHVRLARCLVGTYYSVASYFGTFSEVVANIQLFMSGIWSLDFFKVTNIIAPFCISHRMKTIDVLMLDYVLVLHPLILVLITYTCIELHAQNCRIVIFLWKPFHRCFNKLRRNWNGSIVHAYATLLMLSFAVVNDVTYNLLSVTAVYNMNAAVVKHLVFFDPGMERYEHEHIIYIAIALVVLFFLGFCPALLLCLYPTRLSKMIYCCSARKRIALKIFVETFQGCYKDGLHGTRDYRMTPAISMFVVIVLNITFAIETSHSFLNVAPLCTSLLMISSLLISYIRPCKSWMMNFSLSFHFTLIGILVVVYIIWMQDAYVQTSLLAAAFMVLVTLPHALFLLWVGYKLASYMCTQPNAYL